LRGNCGIASAAGSVSDPGSIAPTTIQDVARRAGVSIATVSRVLNRSPHPVRPELRARVEAAAQELDFRPSSLARGLAGRETQTLALVVPDISNPYYPRLSRGVEDVASAHGYGLIICNTDHSPEKLAIYLRLLREKRVDGVLLAGGGHEGPEEASGQLRAIPPVGEEAGLSGSSARERVDLGRGRLAIHAIGRHPLRAPSVRIDNVEAGRAATHHLLDRGRRRIAFVGGPAAHTTVADRRRGYRGALRAAGLGLSPSLELDVGFSPQDGERAADILLSLPYPPDAVFAFNDNLAVGLIHALLAAGRRVPDDIAVIGFDDIPLAAYFRPSLSSVAVPAYQLGAAAAERLLRQLAGEPLGDIQWLGTRVVARESSGGT
jgi:LacI family transcriptional regulator